MERLLNQDIDKVARKGGTKTGGQLIVPAMGTEDWHVFGCPPKGTKANK